CRDGLLPDESRVAIRDRPIRGAVLGSAAHAALVVADLPAGARHVGGGIAGHAGPAGSVRDASAPRAIRGAGLRSRIVAAVRAGLGLGRLAGFEGTHLTGVPIAREATALGAAV